MLPPLLDVDGIRARLQVIFPDGTPERTKCTGLAAARTIYVMLYVGAIEGGEWLAPKYVYRMGNSQAAKISNTERTEYLTAVKKPGTPEPADRWYRENTRESIRDEALKNGLVPIGAVLVNPHVPTTSSKGRYILRADLAALFDPTLAADKFEAAAATWRGNYLTPNALATVKVLQVAATGAKARCWASKSALRSCFPTSFSPIQPVASCYSCSWRSWQPTAPFTRTAARPCSSSSPMPVLSLNKQPFSPRFRAAITALSRRR
jgi:hypothetical protein